MKMHPGWDGSRRGRDSGRRGRVAGRRTSLRLERFEDRVLMAAGDLDPTFGAGGIVVTDFGPDNVDLDSARDVAIQADGKIVAVGSSFDSFALARYNPDGSLDTSFGGGDGLVVTRIDVGGSFQEAAEGVAIQPDGKIVIAGTTAGPHGSIAVALRYNADGTPDGTFGDGGVAILDLAPTPGPGETLVDDNSNENARDVVLQPDGKIVVVGTATLGGTFEDSGGGTIIRSGDADFLAVRFNADGTPDSTFGAAGARAVNFPTAAGTSSDTAYAAAIQADGKLVLAGNRRAGLSVFFTDDFAAIRLNPDGSLDTTFDTDGFVTVDFDGGGSRFETARDVAIQPDGKVVLAGGNSFDFAAARLNPNGSPDLGFGTDGRQVVTFDLGGGDNADGALAVALDGDGRIVLGGFASRAGGFDFALARLNGDGTLDAGFGGDGRVTTDVGQGSPNAAYGLAIQGDGKIVAAGEVGSLSQANIDFALARYIADSAPPTVLDVVDVAPDPRITPVDAIDVVFSEPIVASGFAVDDLALTRDGAAVPLGAGVTIAPVAGTAATFRISGLAASTSTAGSYTLTVNAAGVADLAGNAGTGSASDSFVVIRPTIADVRVVEGDTGTTQATLTITLASPLAADQPFTFETAPGTATAGRDFTATAGSVTIPAGQTSATFTVPILGDFAPEGDEAFTVPLSAGAQGGPLTDLGTATVTIADDDGADSLVVVNTEDDGIGSLRRAIQVANATPGRDTITFRISGEGVQTIRLRSALPEVTEAVVIDGMSQAQGRPAAGPMIQLSGVTIAQAGATGLANGLVISGGGSTVRGLIINAFSSHGIVLRDGGGNTVTETFIGTDPSGSFDLGNAGVGILVNGSSGNVIGGAVRRSGGTSGAAFRTIISGNDGCGVIIAGASASGNVVRGTIIGMTADGRAELPNRYDGLAILDAPSTVVGGPAESSDVGLSPEGNLISGNGEVGVLVAGRQASGTSIVGNFIGTTIDGTSATRPGLPTLPVGNRAGGVLVVDAPRTGIGSGLNRARSSPGLTSHGNLISGNDQFGIKLLGQGATGNVVIGNFIGTDYSGSGVLSFVAVVDRDGRTVRQAGQVDGIQVVGAPSNSIGYTSDPASDAQPLPTLGNLISGNAGSGVLILGATATEVAVRANFIGTNLRGDGTVGDPSLELAPDPTIQRPMNAPPATLQGNGTGVRIDGAARNLVGDVANRLDRVSTAGNLISANSRVGLSVSGAASSGNVVVGNFVGTDLTGTLGLANGSRGGEGGIQVVNAPSNLIGQGAEPLARDVVRIGRLGNLVSGNAGPNLSIAGSDATGNLVQGNFVGVDLNGAGTIVDPSYFSARFRPEGLVDRSQELPVGILVSDAVGRPVPLNPTATPGAPGPNFVGGAQGNIIGGSNANDRNVISGNAVASIRRPVDPGGRPTRPTLEAGGANVLIEGPTTSRNELIGNVIGLNAAGTSAAVNSGIGVLVRGGSGNFIGLERGGPRNVISGNELIGVLIEDGSVGNLVANNVIGLDIQGQRPTIPADEIATREDRFFLQGTGVLVLNSSANTVGGRAPGFSNIISGNGDRLFDPELDPGAFINPPESPEQLNRRGVGVAVVAEQGRQAVGNSILNNAIGTDLAGNPRPTGQMPEDPTTVGLREALEAVNLRFDTGNLADGILIFGATNTGINAGGVPALANVIAGNGGNGIHLAGGTRGTQVGFNLVGVGRNLSPQIAGINPGNGLFGLLVNVGTDGGSNAFNTANLPGLNNNMLGPTGLVTAADLQARGVDVLVRDEVIVRGPREALIPLIPTAPRPRR